MYDRYIALFNDVAQTVPNQETTLQETGGYVIKRTCDAK